MRILGIETSCDETAISVLEINPPSRKASAVGSTESAFGQTKSAGTVKVLSNTISSQVKLHAKYGGVVPNLAAREHVRNIEHVFKLALKQAGLLKSNFNQIDLIAVTRGPGLGPALLVGITFAKTLAWKYQKPLVGVNHLEGHIYSNWLKPVGVNSKLPITSYQFPILNLIVSGGHTELVLMTGHGKYKLIGETLDDAVGEAFDKVARLLGLGYPGGPAVAKRATEFKVRSLKFKVEGIKFPRPMIGSKNYDFSYSGLKTSVLYKLRDLEKAGVKITENIKDEICYEFQKAATEVLIAKTMKAAREYKVRSIFLSGGVSANKYLRSELEKAAEELKVNYSQPELEYTGDNAAMIAMVGYINYRATKSPSSPTTSLKLRSSRRIRRATNFRWKLVEMDANLGFSSV